MYYLAVHPQVSVSVIELGRLPEALPSWLGGGDLFCAKTLSACFQSYAGLAHQAFVLELDLPEPAGLQINSLALREIDPKKIKRIFVHSEKSHKLLKNLFKQQCPINVVVEESVYPELPVESKKREREPEAVPFPEALPKKQSLNPPEQLSQTKPLFVQPSPKKTPAVPTAAPPSPAKPKQNPLPVISRLSSYPEHLSCLSEAFRTAKRSILITSFGINHETLKEADLYRLIPQARARRVNIYIYFNDKKSLSQGVVNFLERNEVKFDEAFTHSKILAVDRELVVTGSCNWLSIINTSHPESDEGSFVLRGKICNGLIEEFWAYLKHYRNRQYGNVRAIREFEADQDNHSTSLFDVDSTTKIGYVPVLEEHRGFLQDCFRDAKRRVIIVSPFISASGQYQQDIDHRLLREATMRGVDVFFVCSASSPALGSFDAFLAQLNSPKIRLIVLDNIHLKTIVVDESLIAEGSFNWLSASRDDESDFHNHEQTLYVEGIMAKGLIDQFFQSSSGLKVQAEIQKPLGLVYQRMVPDAMYVPHAPRPPAVIPQPPNPAQFFGAQAFPQQRLPYSPPRQPPQNFWNNLAAAQVFKQYGDESYDYESYSGDSVDDESGSENSVYSYS